METSSFKHDGVPSICKTDANRCTFDFDFESSSDLDGNWTEAPWLHESITSHVHMVNDDSQGLDDIVLDSGADVGAPVPVDDQAPCSINEQTHVEGLD